jgi:hypothetical protein
VAAADHGRIADEGVDGARARRQIGELILRPAANIVVLRIGEWSAV